MPTDVAARNYRPGKRDILVAHLIDAIVHLGSPTLREVVTEGTKRALWQAVSEPGVELSEVFFGGDGATKCPDCDGSGSVWVEFHHGEQEQDCPTCDGTGVQGG